MARCGHEEDIQHLFLSCSTFGTLWQLVRSWIGFDGVDSQVISDHFQQFIYYTGGLKLRRTFLQLIWLLCAWIVWNKRNNMLFKQKENNMFQLLEKVKSYSFMWFKVKKVRFVFGTWVSTDLYLYSDADFVYYSWSLLYTLC
ncbi:hypothetical protein MTR_5g054960 [Medicago truncatula]|uniref:Reverse transcriptase zinc-binding domain-containing protein n=1 Tax=Medicago truncatula TaxID=3880 RepID=G7JZD0_MEDTR|nr:hypothetical protein MTR_5g054960 [Medicago truncatula]